MFNFDITTLDLRDVEDVVDQLQQQLPGRLKFVQQGFLAAGEFGVEQRKSCQEWRSSGF